MHMLPGHCAIPIYTSGIVTLVPSNVLSHLEAVLRLEMSSDVEITGYQEAPPSPERVDLTKEVKTRQRSLLEFTSVSPGPSGSSSSWPVFLQRFKPADNTRKRPVQQQIGEECPGDSSEDDSPSQPAARNTKPRKNLPGARGRYSVYTLQFKLQAIRDVQSSDVVTVAKKLKLPRSTLETWLKKYKLEELERKLKKGKGKGISKKGAHLKSGSGRPLSYPQRLDEELAEWVLCQRDLQRPVSVVMLKAKAKATIGSKYPSFKASGGWTEKFMRRHSLSLCAKTSVSQKLPVDLEAKLEQFLKQVRAQRKAYDYPAEMILNMDETPMYFDLIPGRTLSKKGKRQVIVRGTTATKRHLTVVLTCTAAGHMLPPMIIFKGKRELKLRRPPGYVVTVQKKGWMDGEHMTTWLKKIVLPYTKKAKTLLILDSFSAHTDAPFALLASKSNINLAVIPGGCTSKVQPLDVSVNKPFKDVARHQWIEFITSCVETTKSGNLKAATKEQVVAWVKQGMEYLTDHPGMIKKAFLVCGLSNKMDGSENHLIRCAAELIVALPYGETEESDSEGDPFADSDESSEGEDSTSCEEAENTGDEEESTSEEEAESTDNEEENTSEEEESNGDEDCDRH